MKTKILLCSLLAGLAIGHLPAQDSKSAPATDPGWPRQRASEQGTLIYYQPQVDDWKDFKELNFRMAFSLTPKGGKEVIGVLVLQAQSERGRERSQRYPDRFQDQRSSFSRARSGQGEQDGGTGAQLPAAQPHGRHVSGSAGRERGKVEGPTTTVKVQNDPPAIFVSYSPAILLFIDGEPKRADISGTDLGFVVNSNFPLFFEKDGLTAIIYSPGAQWLKGQFWKAPGLRRPKLPRGFCQGGQ